MSLLQAKKLGEKYILLDLLGTGGMAEVYRGKLLGEKGFQKPIVIKKLLPQVVKDKEMTDLFIGEAKLAALLQHENIAATYDFGELDNNFFLAMEYLFGKDLYSVIRRAKERGQPLGMQRSLMIAAKICEGMEYAHTLKDLQNNPLNIIHRDLTPQNIFITYDGKVKVIDFGVAKAEMLDTKTRAGVVKGKLSYMSPEQISGAKVDSRSDIFSIGILLYEMISQRRMYDGDTAALIRKSITVEYEHLENIYPDLPPQLYAILHKALTSDVDSRYQNCSEMQADIENLLFSLPEKSDSKVLREYLLELYTVEYESEQTSMVKAMETVVTNSDKEAEPESDKTVLYDTMAGVEDQKKPFVPSNSATGEKNWLGSKQGYFLIASVCLIALVAVFLLLGGKEKDVTPAASVTPVGQEATITQEATTAPVVSTAQEAPMASSAQETPTTKVAQEVPDTQKPAVTPESTTAPIISPPAVKMAAPAVQDVPEKLTKSERKSRARELADKAEKALSERRFSEAQGFIDEGLKLSPYYQKLNKLYAEIKKEKEPIIQDLAQKAEQRFNENNLTTPEGESAFDYYRAIQKIEPDNPLAQAALQKIADRYAAMADDAYRYFDFETTRRHVEKGLMVMPSHPHLLELNKELDKSKAENYKKSTEDHVKRIANEAEKVFEGLFSK